MQLFGISSLTEERAPLSTSQAEDLALDHWGLKGVATRLPAEIDENFRLDCDAGSYLLKVLPSDQDEVTTQLLTAVLVHLSDIEGVEVQQLVRTLRGEEHAEVDDGGGAGRRARLTTFIDGVVLRAARLDPDLRRRLGQALATVRLKLASFDHPGASRELSWDLRHAGRMGAMLAELPANRRRRELAACLERFEREVSPRLEHLPAQVVHNDLSRDNAVLTEHGAIGVIDLGDVVRTQRVNDLAIAMADQLDESEDPMRPAFDLARGYLDVATLEDAEIDLLPELVRTRVATRIVGGEWRAHRFPANREYLSRNVERLWRIFVQMPTAATATDLRRLERLKARRG